MQWGASLEDFVDRGDDVEAVINSGVSSERSVHAYVVGCDGAHSRVREVLALGFRAGPPIRCSTSPMHS